MKPDEQVFAPNAISVRSSRPRGRARRIYRLLFGLVSLPRPLMASETASYTARTFWPPFDLSRHFFARFPFAPLPWSSCPPLRSRGRLCGCRSPRSRSSRRSCLRCSPFTRGFFFFFFFFSWPASSLGPSACPSVCRRVRSSSASSLLFCCLCLVLGLFAF
jgi:hypothetical protein